MRLLYTAPELSDTAHIAQSLKHLGVAVLLKPRAYPNTYICENVRARDHSRLELKASQCMRKRTPLISKSTNVSILFAMYGRLNFRFCPWFCF